jgi:hypothetical protein
MESNPKRRTNHYKQGGREFDKTQQKGSLFRYRLSSSQKFQMTKRRAYAYVALPQTMPFTPSYQYTDTLCLTNQKEVKKDRDGNKLQVRPFDDLKCTHDKDEC